MKISQKFAKFSLTFFFSLHTLVTCSSGGGGGGEGAGGSQSDGGGEVGEGGRIEKQDEKELITGRKKEKEIDRKLVRQENVF